MPPLHQFIRSVELLAEKVPDRGVYPWNLPALRNFESLKLDPHATFFVGENGSGKSTLLEAIAIAAGMNPEGGSRNFNFGTYRSESPLSQTLRLVRGVRRPRTDFFLRAESFYNLATEVERVGVTDSYGGKSLHAVSHGESFMALANHRFGPNGLYLLDEPEAALSPQRQLALLARMHELVRAKSQFIIATHAPILLAYPEATIYLFSERGIERVEYEDTEHYALTRDFLMDRGKYLRRLFDE